MKTNGKRTYKPGRTYPESSARQALHGQRRAQGGPGITEGSNPQSRGVQVIGAQVDSSTQENILD